MFFDIDDGSGGTIRQRRTPVGAPEAARPPPRQGELTAQVLAEYGFDAGEIAALSGGTNR